MTLSELCPQLLDAFGLSPDDFSHNLLADAYTELGTEAIAGAVGGVAGGYFANGLAAFRRATPVEFGGETSAAEQIPGVCFVAGTAIATAKGAQPIEALQVGDRVLTNDQNAETTGVDPATWRKITLRMPNPEQPSDIMDLQLLRSKEWMQEVSCSEGARIWFNLDEMGLHGWADVVEVEPCPPIQSGPGRVVLATVTHFNSFVMEVRLAGVSEVLQPTDRHRLFSVTRNDWVPSVQLTVGEELATKTGVVRVESIKAKPGTHRVYNIEVETEHCYYAGAAQVLSHNNNPCAMPGKLPRYDGPKPTYTVNPTHVPGSLRPGKTPLPADAEFVFRNAVPNDPVKPTAWFGRNADGQIYRFGIDNNGTAHFNGIHGVGDGTRNLTQYAIDRINGL